MGSGAQGKFFSFLSFLYPTHAAIQARDKHSDVTFFYKKKALLSVLQENSVSSWYVWGCISDGRQEG